jgi:beta-lactamase regulating signal transducer with metallopeptidase domain
MTVSNLAPVLLSWLAAPAAGLALEVSAKIALAFLFTLLLTAALKDAPPEVRHALWLVTAVGTLALPSLTMIVPHWSLVLPPAPDEAVTRTARLESLVLMVWLVGALASAGVTLVGVLATRRLVQSARRVTTSEWIEPLESIARALNVSQPIALLVSPEVTVPLTWGGWRPVVLLPKDAGGWTPERRRAVLFHEVTHIARGDFLIEALLWFVSALYWFHPAVWEITRRVRLERELACDASVLGTGIRASDYAEHLVEIMRSATRLRRAIVGAAAVSSPTALHRRVIAILDFARTARPASRARYVPVALWVTALIALAVPKPEPSCPDAAAAAAVLHHAARR